MTTCVAADGLCIYIIKLVKEKSASEVFFSFHINPAQYLQYCL